MKMCMAPERYRFGEIDAVFERVSDMLIPVSVIGFTGSLGAGKTTLVQKLLRRAGVVGPIASPTFSYVHSYRVEQMMYHHFDLYRLKTLDDFIQAGFDEYLYQPNTQVFIEWPEIIMPLLTHDACIVHLEYQGADEREVSICCLD